MGLGSKNAERNKAFKDNLIGYRSSVALGIDILHAESHPLAYKYRSVTLPQKDAAMAVYARAGRPQLGFLVLGRGPFGSRTGMSSTIRYPLADFPLVLNVGLLNESLDELGSVLSSNSWSFLLNDLFMSGAVANRVPFYLASNRNMKTLWEPGSMNASIYARELAGLFIAGYEIHRLADGSEAMLPPSEPHALPLGVNTYMKALPAYLNKWTVNKMGSQNLIKMLYNSRSNKVISVRFAV